MDAPNGNLQAVGRPIGSDMPGLGTDRGQVLLTVVLAIMVSGLSVVVLWALPWAPTAWQSLSCLVGGYVVAGYLIDRYGRYRLGLLDLST
jgi:hypothetical protein